MNARLQCSLQKVFKCTKSQRFEFVNLNILSGVDGEPGPSLGRRGQPPPQTLGTSYPFRGRLGNPCGGIFFATLKLSTWLRPWDDNDQCIYIVLITNTQYRMGDLNSVCQIILEISLALNRQSCRVMYYAEDSELSCSATTTSDWIMLTEADSSGSRLQLLSYSVDRDDFTGRQTKDPLLAPCSDKNVPSLQWTDNRITIITSSCTCTITSNRKQINTCRPK